MFQGGECRVGRDLELVRLGNSFQRVEKHGRVVGCPEVDVHGVQPIHVFAVVARVGSREMPFGHVLLGTRGGTPALAAETIDGDGEQTRVLV